MRKKTSGATAFPRMCGGDPYRYLDYMQKITLFPACAGVILEDDAAFSPVAAFPRMCGGDPAMNAGSQASANFSPHVRG